MSQQSRCTLCDSWSGEIAFEATCPRCGRTAQEVLAQRRLRRGPGIRNLPRAVTRIIFRFMAMMFLAIALSIAAFIVFAVRRQLPVAMLAVLANVLLVLAIFGLMALVLRRLLARAVRAGFRLCPRCCYSLEHCGTQTVSCPECGATADIGEVEQAWRNVCIWYPWLVPRRSGWSASRAGRKDAA